MREEGLAAKERKPMGRKPLARGRQEKWKEEEE